MNLDKRYAAACLQILREDDLTLPDTISKKLEKRSFAAEFIEDSERHLYLKLYGNRHFMLTQIVPILQNIGLQIHSEISYEIPIDSKNAKSIYVSRYRIGNDEIDKIRNSEANILLLVEQMLCHPSLENTPLLQLTVKENLSPRELELLSALIDYENQLVLSLNKVTITQVLIKHHEITRKLLEYFHLKFNPSAKRKKAMMEERLQKIEQLRKPITHITEDTVLRIMTEIVQQMMRTNYFLDKDEIAFKIRTDQIESLADKIEPKIEAFVHSYRLSGVHLRMHKISRGGIRWSDRCEDFRIEIRDLMLTQEGKNAVIVPGGAKGGFIIRLPRKEITKERFKDFYERFIDALLDLVDNLEDGHVVTDSRIIRYDDDDTYFVVAADKGTSHMSDTANAIALKRGFWLGDAFASGGSKGYNHKELGITAKGAMRSVERYFIEHGKNLYETPVTVVGIGSMNGDVFGNGMLLSKNFKLLAAISHNEVFIDPDPDPEISYLERKRLFEASPNGGWDHYDPEKISEGGGVFRRDEKEIPLSNAMQKLFRTTKRSMSGEELVRAALCLKADMLFNGGVGTYVKASWESNLEVGDKTNENVRVDASSLKVHAVCEGGNLGFTLPARIEYAKNGGFINLDAIDNSAGVNTSDYEVNLKITLGTLVSKGQLDEESRLEALQKQADMVTNRVLWTNYHQSLAISLDQERSQEDLIPFLDTIRILERDLAIFNRKRFHIPKDEDISLVCKTDGGLVRPILATLLSYAKIFVKRKILASDLCDDSFAQEFLLKYFPKSFATLYEDEILRHPLRKQIAATVMADHIINNAGVTFVADIDEIGEERFLSKIKSYLICNQLFGSNDIRYEIFRQDYKMPALEQYALLLEVESTLDFSVSWMIRHLSSDQIHAPTLLRYRSELSELLSMIPDEEITPIVSQKSPINRFFHHLPYMKFTIAAIILHEKNHRRFTETAQLMYAIIKELHINEIMAVLERYRPKEGKEHTIKKQLKEFVEFAVTSLSEKVINYQRKDESMDSALRNYLHESEERYKALQEAFTSFMAQEKREKLEEIEIVVNSLLQMALESPL